jgi:hypothetical protein
MDHDMKDGGSGGEQKLQVQVAVQAVVGDAGAAAGAAKPASNALAALKRKGPEPLADPNKVDTRKLDQGSGSCPMVQQAGCGRTPPSAASTRSFPGGQRVVNATNGCTPKMYYCKLLRSPAESFADRCRPHNRSGGNSNMEEDTKELGLFRPVMSERDKQELTDALQGRSTVLGERPEPDAAQERGGNEVPRRRHRCGPMLFVRPRGLYTNQCRVCADEGVVKPADPIPDAEPTRDGKNCSRSSLRWYANYHFTIASRRRCRTEFVFLFPVVAVRRHWCRGSGRPGERSCLLRSSSQARIRWQQRRLAGPVRFIHWNRSWRCPVHIAQRVIARAACVLARVFVCGARGRLNEICIVITFCSQSATRRSGAPDGSPKRPRLLMLAVLRMHTEVDCTEPRPTSNRGAWDQIYMYSGLQHCCSHCLFCRPCRISKPVNARGW